MANKIRSIFNKFGLDLHRYRHEPDKLVWIKNQNIKTVLDIGANTGQFASEIRGKLPEAQIYSFEPIKECFEKLVSQGEALGKFEAFNFALGEKAELKEMNKSAYTPSSSILWMSDVHKKLFPHTQDHSIEQIKVKRLDDLGLRLEPEILIKVDVQGFEDKVISGGIETFKKAKVVLIENSFVELYEGQPLFDDIYGKLKGLGFVYKGSLQQKLNKKTGEIISEDSIFVRPKF